MKRFASVAVYLIILITVVSCGQDPTRAYHEDQKHTTPRLEYTADVDMYRSPSYETYSTNPNYEDGMSARQPVEGTVPRGHLPYGYPKTNAGYDSAGVHLKNPIPLTDDVLAEGKRLYRNYCTQCHGANGKGDGKMVKNDKFPPIPAYDSPTIKDLPEGKLYHSITLGKNLMPAHASQLYPEERWTIIHYIQTLQGKDEAAANGEDATGEPEEPAPAPAPAEEPAPPEPDNTEEESDTTNNGK